MKNKKTHTLVIWEDFPENIKYYLIDNNDITEEYRNFLEKSQNKYINGDPFDEILELRILCSMFSEEDSWCDSELDRKYDCVWKDYKIDSSKKIENVNINQVYKFGFYL